MKQVLQVFCPKCGRSFYNSREFRNHKHVGPCMTDEELIAAGWKRNTAGAWSRNKK